ncbi:hypothetical protein [Actinoplanes sp. NPDC026623]|uniref:hypothetical protein n=1 Tax=Actinoplanes sp. NPDC026623 TaxID=3155610 RepID=UPI0033D2A1FA
MSSVRPVPSAPPTVQSEPSLREIVRQHGVVTLLRQSVLRFWYGDAFSHARALALLLCLAVVPLLIALTGLADEAGVDEGGRLVVRVTLGLTPGRSDDLVRRLLSDGLRTCGRRSLRNGGAGGPARRGGRG